MKHYFVGGLLSIGGISLTPVIAYGVGEDGSGAVESGARDRSADGRISLQSMLRVFVPEVECAVAPCRAESPVNRVERNCIEGVDVIHVAIAWRGFSMTLEAEIGTRVLLLDILDGTTALYTADSKSRGICKTADCACLELERGLHGLIEFGGVIQVNDVNVTVSCADD